MRTYSLSYGKSVQQLFHTDRRTTEGSLEPTSQ